jgi:hypothetical protein
MNEAGVLAQIVVLGQAEEPHNLSEGGPTAGNRLAMQE